MCISHWVHQQRMYHITLAIDHLSFVFFRFPLHVIYSCVYMLYVILCFTSLDPLCLFCFFFISLLCACHFSDCAWTCAVLGDELCGVGGKQLLRDVFVCLCVCGVPCDFELSCLFQPCGVYVFGSGFIDV